MNSFYLESSTPDETIEQLNSLFEQLDTEQRLKLTAEDMPRYKYWLDNIYYNKLIVPEELIALLQWLIDNDMKYLFKYIEVCGGWLKFFSWWNYQRLWYERYVEKKGSSKELLAFFK